MEPSQISNEIQAWTENFEQKNKDRIMKLREEMENKLEANSKETRTNKVHLQKQIPGLQQTELRTHNLRGPKNDKSIGVHASNIENSDTEDEDHPLRASEMQELRNLLDQFTRICQT